MKQTIEQVQEQAIQQQESYRAKCTHRRRKDVVEEKQGDDWVSVYSGGKMNEAKRVSRRLNTNQNLYSI
jgi:hypothetical protein